MNSIFETQDESAKRDWLISHLRNGKVEIKFTKVDGTIRVMNCSLSPTLLPVATQVTESTKRSTTPNVIRVFDIDKQAWRSFKIENVIAVTI